LGVSKYVLIRLIVEQGKILKDESMKERLDLFETHFFVESARHRLQRQQISTAK
jgi:hypothetical protein